MRQTTRIAPANSMLFISGSRGVEIPDMPRESDVAIWSTPTCVIFGCRMFADGETEVTLCPADDVDTRLRPRFDAMLKTPDHEVVVWTVEDETILRAKVANVETRVRIWSDHANEPDNVIVGLG